MLDGCEGLYVLPLTVDLFVLNKGQFNIPHARGPVKGTMIVILYYVKH